MARIVSTYPVRSDLHGRSHLIRLVLNRLFNSLFHCHLILFSLHFGLVAVLPRDINQVVELVRRKDDRLIPRRLGQEAVGLIRHHQAQVRPAAARRDHKAHPVRLHRFKEGKAVIPDCGSLIDLFLLPADFLQRLKPAPEFRAPRGTGRCARRSWPRSDTAEAPPDRPARPFAPLPSSGILPPHLCHIRSRPQGNIF